MTSTTCSLYKYIWEVILNIVLIGKIYLKLDKLSKTIDQAKNTKNKIREV